MEWTGASLGERRSHTVVEEIGVIALKVIGQFAFDAGVRTYVKSCPAPDANKVDDIGPVKAVVISKGTDLDMLFRLRKKSGWRSQQECQHRKHSNTFHKWFSP